MPKQSKLENIVNHFEESVIAFLFAAMTLVTFFQVVARYVFNSGATWALETTTYLFAWLVMFGISYLVKTNGHLGVDSFVRLFGKGTQRIFGLIAVSASMIYSALLFYGGYTYIMKLKKIGIYGEDIHVQRWILNIILPIGLALVFFRLAQVGWRILTGEQPGLVLADEAADAMKQHLEAMDADDKMPGPDATSTDKR